MPSPSHSEPQSSTELRLRQELIAQARFLDGLVESLGAVSSTLGGSAVLARTAREAQRLFDADAAVVLTPAAGTRTLRPVASAGLALGPLADLTVGLDEHDSPLAVAARDLAPAVAVAGELPADELTRRLQPASLLAAPLVAAGRLHALLLLLDLGSGRAFGPADLGQAAGGAC